jgi:hypothetical protein
MLNIGKKMSTESIEKTRIAHIGMKRSKETCEKIGKSKIGFKFSEESILRLKENCPHKRKISQFDLNGNFIKKWDSIMEASRETKIPTSNISRCCSSIRKSAGGYIWNFQN